MSKRMIPHEFRKEIVLPWGAIPDNVNILSKKGVELETSDGKICVITSAREIHMLSSEAADLIFDLYKINVMQFLRAWFKKLPCMSSMFLIHLKLDEKENTEPEELSE